MKEKYSLNAETLKYIIEYEKDISKGQLRTNQELVQSFRNSPYHKSVFDTYIKEAISKSIWYAVKRSGNWDIVKRGTYKRI